MTEVALNELRAAGIIITRGATRATFRYVDERVRLALQQPRAQRRANPAWRELRARCGGLELQLARAQRRADEATNRLREATTAPPSITTAPGVEAWVRLEALHALACTDGPEFCERCSQLKATLRARRSGDEAADAAALALEEAADVMSAARAVVEAMRGGERTRASDALRDLERMVRP
jgi:hypothetical protein